MSFPLFLNFQLVKQPGFLRGEQFIGVGQKDREEIFWPFVHSKLRVLCARVSDVAKNSAPHLKLSSPSESEAHARQRSHTRNMQIFQPCTRVRF